MKNLKQNLKAAFTLIELLVVIAIIMILAALLLPAFSYIRMRADTVVCMNNLRQLSVSLALYQGDYGGAWPAPFNRNCGAGSGWVISWDSQTDTFWADTNKVLQGTLYPYTSNLNIYVCPTFRKIYKMNASFAQLKPACTYTFNTFIDSCGGQWIQQPTLHRWQVMDELSQLAVLGDEGVFIVKHPVTGENLNAYYINNLAMGVGRWGPMDCVASFHNSADPYKGKGNVAFGDGRVELVEPYRSIELFTPRRYR